MDEVHAAKAPSMGTSSHRIDPSHRATVLIRLPNVAEGSTGGRGIALLRQAWGGLLAVVKRIIHRNPAGSPADGATDAKAQENRPMLDLFLKILVGARRFGPLAKPLAFARRIPLPVIVAGVVSTALILHMTLAYNDAQPASPQANSEAPHWDNTAPAATAVAPTDGNTPAPTNPVAAERQKPADAWSNQPADLGAARDTFVGPPIPGVARLRGRIESVSPSDTPRHERYR